MKLVIIESPGKIKKFKECLGSDYEIVSSIGHCVDLPPKGLSIDIKNDFAPTFEVNEDKKDIVKSLVSKAKQASTVYLMTDEDREGEAIAWHIYNLISKSSNVPIHRASTNEITKAGITKAINNARCIDLQMIDAYLCRRMLDRLCGYKTSFLTKQATGGRSAGRVQSAILRILVEKEKDIMHFVPKEYWVLTANFLTKKNEAYVGILDEKIEVSNEAEATKIYDSVIKGKPVVSEVESHLLETKPYAPFTTMTLIQSASTYLGWPSKKVMKTAQSLYEAGSISYMRTDSPFMAEEAMSAVRAFVDHSYGGKYLSSSPVKYSAKSGAQEGHECCRPTDMSKKIAASGDEQKLYEMIWKRAIASQMSSGSDQKVKVATNCGGYDFISKGSICVFDGFRKVWDYASKDDVKLPVLAKGDKPTLESLDKEQRFTKPPPRYSDASLSKKCEDDQITRPSTFASSITTLLDRGYITQEKKAFQATDLGIKVVDFLVGADMCFVSTKFTAEMENKLDQVASNQLPKLELMTEFWTRLKQDIANGEKIKGDNELTEFDCPKCKAKLKLKHSKFGSFFSCSKYSKKEDGCDYKAQVGEDGKPFLKEVKQKEYASFDCKCGNKMVKRSSKYGEFYGCSKFPTCKVTADLEGVFKEPKKFTKNKFYKKKKGNGHD